MLRDSVAVAVVRTRPRAIPLAMITMRKSTRGFPFLSYTSMGIRLGSAKKNPIVFCDCCLKDVAKNRFQELS